MTTGAGAFLFTLPNPVPAGLEPRDGLAEATGFAGFSVRFTFALESLVMGVPIDRPMSEVFREALLLLLELTAGCRAIIEEFVSKVREPCELEGSMVEFGRPLRDDPLELVPVWLGFLIDGEIGSPRRVRLFELTAGCLAMVEVDGVLTVICLPIRERVLRCKVFCGLFELVTGCLDEAEVDGCRVVI